MCPGCHRGSRSHTVPIILATLPLQRTGGPFSKAPMSQAGPCGRGTPRWSVRRTVSIIRGLASMAGLPAGLGHGSRVGPPLLASVVLRMAPGPSLGTMSVAAGAEAFYPSVPVVPKEVVVVGDDGAAAVPSNLS